LIIGVLGNPTEDDLEFIANDHAKRYLREMERATPVPLEQFLAVPNINPDAIDLLTKMLCFNPYKRITVDEALRHPYLEEYYEESEDEVDELAEVDLEFERRNLSVEEMKEMLIQECRLIEL
jgi:mitogen-activated protein kinase 1/3